MKSGLIIFIFTLIGFLGATQTSLAQKAKQVSIKRPIKLNKTLPADTFTKPKVGTPELFLNVIDFGAIPNDGKDDSEAIQKAIDAAIASTKISKVYIPSGVFDLEKGIVAARQQKDGEYFFNTITISGHVAAFTPIQSIGNTTVLYVKHKGFGLAFQLARQCVVENIAFLGVAKYVMSQENIINYKAEDWGVKGGQSTNYYSPSCGIAIDPFHSSVKPADRYSVDAKYYKNTGSGGTSMLTIRGCAFERFYIAIANNPSNAIANGDNIRAETCHAAFCHTFWSCGQTQSRANSIDNVYAIIIHTFINGRQIGQQQGTPPMVSNVNIAGFCKELINISTGFSGIHFYRTYAESIWSLGRAMTSAVSFDQCQFQFAPPNEEVFAPPFLLYAVSPVSFRDCSLEYFSNCTYRMPFMINAPAVNISGGSVEGGLVLAGGYSNAGGEAMHRVKHDNVKINCIGKIAGKKTSAVPLSNLDGQIIMGGETLTSTDGKLIMNTSTTYDIQSLEKVKVTINQKTKKATFTSKNPALYSIGDNLFPEANNINPTIVDMGVGNNVNYCFGYVSTIKGNEIEISGVPCGVASSEYYLIKATYPVYNVSNKNKKLIEYKQN